MDNFENIISDEMLAAYIDGNAIPIEENIIRNCLDNEELQELLEIISDINSNPELIDSGESLQAEIPDRLFEGQDNPLEEIKRDVEDSDKHVM